MQFIVCTNLQNVHIHTYYVALLHNDECFSFFSILYFYFFVLLPSKRRTKTRIVVDRKRKTKIHTLNYSRSSHSHRKKIAKQKQENRETAEIEMVSMKMRKHRYLFNISQFALMDFQFCSFIVRHTRFHYIFFFPVPFFSFNPLQYM